MEATVKSLGLLTFVVAVFLGFACEKAPELDRVTAKRAVESSEAFRGSWDPKILFDGGPIARDSSWRREIVSVDAVQVYGTGVSSTARAAFIWRWNAGPFEGSTFKSIATFIHTGGGWKLQEEKLRNELWRQERRSE